MLVRSPPARGPRELEIHLSEAGRAAPSPFAPGTLKARSSAGSTIWAAALLGFLFCLLNVLFSCKPISPFRLPGERWERSERPSLAETQRLPRRSSRAQKGVGTPGGVDASLPGFGPQSFLIY